LQLLAPRTHQPVTEELLRECGGAPPQPNGYARPPGFL